MRRFTANPSSDQIQAEAIYGIELEINKLKELKVELNEQLHPKLIEIQQQKQKALDEHKHIGEQLTNSTPGQKELSQFHKRLKHIFDRPHLSTFNIPLLKTLMTQIDEAINAAAKDNPEVNKQLKDLKLFTQFCTANYEIISNCNANETKLSDQIKRNDSEIEAKIVELEQEIKTLKGEGGTLTHVATYGKDFHDNWHQLK